MSKLFDSNGREVVDAEIEAAGVDSFFTYAVYMDDGSEVDETELDYLTSTYPEYLDAACFEAAICAAEAWADRDR